MILGEPRSHLMAIEWMSTHLVEKFDTAEGEPLRCKMCHAGNVGSKEWNPRVILTDHLPPHPERASIVEATPDAGVAPPPDAGDPLAPDAGSADGG
jgi:hypothetical protein